MKIVTINLTEPILNALKTLTDAGMYSSRSEAIRVALRMFIGQEMELLKILLPVTPPTREEKIQQEKHLQHVRITYSDMRKGLSDKQIALINHNLDIEMEKIRKEARHGVVYE